MARNKLVARRRGRREWVVRETEHYVSDGELIAIAIRNMLDDFTLDCSAVVRGEVNPLLEALDQIQPAPPARPVRINLARRRTIVR
jgi:hypothetical protein